MTDGIIQEVIRYYQKKYQFLVGVSALLDVVEQELIEKIKQDITADYIQKERAWKIIEKLIGDNQK